MPGETGIAWCNYTWNVFLGCTRDNEECENCYAEILTATRLAHLPMYQGLSVIRGDGRAHWTNIIRVVPDRWDWPLRKQKPGLVFTNAMSDPFHKDALRSDQVRFFAIMLLGDHHTYQVLTKRPFEMALVIRDPAFKEEVFREARRFWREEWLGKPRTDGRAGKPYPEHKEIWPLPHVWLGTSAGRQKSAEEKIPDLLTIPQPWNLWVSSEPMIGRIHLHKTWGYGAGPCRKCSGTGSVTVPFYGSGREPDMPVAPDRDARVPCEACKGRAKHANRLRWIVTGGESGYKDRARPMHPLWPHLIDMQAKEMHIAHFYKQPGNWRALDPETLTRLLVTDPEAGAKEWKSEGLLALDAYGNRYNAHADAVAKFKASGKTSGLVVMIYDRSKEGDRLLDGKMVENYPEGMLRDVPALEMEIAK